MVNQSPTGELEVLQGKSSYTFAGNWKLQNENGLDGYHVSTVHYNYVSTVQHRQQVNASKGEELDTLDYSKLGAGDSETDDGWFSFKMAIAYCLVTCRTQLFVRVTVQLCHIWSKNMATNMLSGQCTV